MKNSIANNPFRIDSTASTDNDPFSAESSHDAVNGIKTSDSLEFSNTDVDKFKNFDNSDIFSPEIEDDVSSPKSNVSEKLQQEAIVDMIKSTTNEIPVSPVTLTTSVTSESKKSSGSDTTPTLSPISNPSLDDTLSPTKDVTISNIENFPQSNVNSFNDSLLDNNLSPLLENTTLSQDLDMTSPVKDAAFVSVISITDNNDLDSNKNNKSPEVEIKITPTPSPRSTTPPRSLSTSSSLSSIARPLTSPRRKTPSPTSSATSDTDMEVDVDPVTGMIVPRRPKPAFLQNLLAKKVVFLIHSCESHLNPPILLAGCEAVPGCSYSCTCTSALYVVLSLPMVTDHFTFI